MMRWVQRLGLSVLVLAVLQASPVRAALVTPSVESAPASSLPMQCGDGSGSSAIIQLEAGLQFSVYARVPKAGTGRAYTLYAQDLGATGACLQTAPTVLTDAAWQSIGTLASGPSGAVYTLTLGAPGVDGAFASDKPQVLLLPVDSPPCRAEATCTILYQNQNATLSPRSIALPSDSLEVLRATPLLGDTVKQVNYLVDSQFAYRQQSLTSFDLRYVPGGKHLLTRQVVFTSGQSISLNQDYAGEQQWWGSVARVSAYYFLTYRQGFILLGLLLLLVFSGLGWQLLQGYLLEWRLRHDHATRATFTRHSQTQTTGSAAKQIADSDAGYRRFIATYWLGLAAKLLGWLALAAGVALLIWNYGLAFFGVSGVSMFPTFHDADGMAISRLGRTWADMAGRPYVPHRFAIIIFKRETGIAGSGEVEYVVKRVYGLPGERVVVRDGKVVIYNSEHPKGYNPDDGKYWRYPVTTEGAIDTVVQPGEVFVLGDNRPESIDSRVFGAVRSDMIVGDVGARLTPIKSFKIIPGE